MATKLVRILVLLMFVPFILQAQTFTALNFNKDTYVELMINKVYYQSELDSRHVDIIPIQLKDSTYILPLNILDDINFKELWDALDTLIVKKINDTMLIRKRLY